VQRIRVDSSDIVSIGYDPKTFVLEIEFKEDRIYDYFDVESDVYDRFMRADSFGEYFFASINKRYRYKRVDATSDQATKPGIVTFITSNAEKVRYLRAACEQFDIEVEQLDLPVEEIQSHEPEKVALHKAKHAYRLTGHPVLIQDTFWNILTLHGFPGAYMHDVAEWFRPEDFLALMQDKTDRTVIRTHTLVYYDGKRSKVFAKDILGVIANEARGTAGVSIDKVVITNGQTETNGQILEKPTSFTMPIEDTAWYEFAKWYNLQRRLGKV